MDLKEQIISVLQQCYDPELPVDLWNLGLIYEIDLQDDGKDNTDVNITIPTLMLAGEKDEAESIDVYKELQQLAEKNTYPLSVILYPDSYRKFDEKREKHSVTVNNVTLTKAYNEKAHEDSIKQVFSFLGN